MRCQFSRIPAVSLNALPPGQYSIFVMNVEGSFAVFLQTRVGDSDLEPKEREIHPSGRSESPLSKDTESMCSSNVNITEVLPVVIFHEFLSSLTRHFSEK